MVIRREVGFVKRVYRGSKRQEIRFPLGGIGTGCIGLDGTGRLVDWEIFNRPNKNSLNGFTHFGIKAEKDGNVCDVRIMNADLLGPYTGIQNYGYGPDRHYLAGVPHFHESEFYGEFPLARIQFLDESFPGSVSLDAYNPFIPSNSDDSSIPAAFFTACVRNTASEKMKYTFELSVSNPSRMNHIHRIVQTDHFKGIELADDREDSGHPCFGSLIFGVPAYTDVQYQRYWYRGSWFDSLGIFWQDFSAPGELHDRCYRELKNGEDIASIAVCAELEPGECFEQRFLIGWYYPNCANYWSPTRMESADWDAAPEQISSRTWKNWYARLFESSSAVADYCMKNWDRLYDDTKLFHDALYSSTLPEEAMEAVGATISVLKSPTVFRLSEGGFYGFEGCNVNTGSCEGSCTHVWNYAMALPFLFPSLARSMRELDYTYNQREDGSMAFRLQLPLGKKAWAFRSCVDGQMGGIIKMYREWKLSGNDDWLKIWWPKVKRSLEYAWSSENQDRWDPEQTGVISGRQHHTLDMELFGPNSWLNGFYLGALKAAAEMAEAMGERTTAERYISLFNRGREYTDSELFNGEYYCQKIDIRDKSILYPYAEGSTLTGGDTIGTYWSDETGQIKYQIGEGCGIDQVLAQWMCDIAGVGEILDQEHVRSALMSIYRYNFKTSFRKHFNPCRIYALNDDAGLVICDWPKGREKPRVPVPYSEESMHGFEYQAATHMIRHGFEKEGLSVVGAIRRRYDGEKRNPWNEMECGSNYARSMASYALLLVYSGFVFDMRKGRLGMLPIRKGQYFFSVDGAWGTCKWTDDMSEIRVLYGTVCINEWVIPDCGRVSEVCLNGSPVPVEVRNDMICSDSGFMLTTGGSLRARYE